MSNPPKINHLSEIGPATKAAHISAFAKLNLNASAMEACKTCPKPVWFTAFFDGTGNNFEADGFGKTEVSKVKYSNVAKLAHFAHVEKDGGRVRYEYIEGVGTKCDKVGDTGGGMDGAVGMAAAGKGEARIRWMLKQLDDHVTLHMPHVNQINLAVFGFSRGATQARAFVRMLTEHLAEEKGDELNWKKPGLDNKHPQVVVYFMGLFDTVASVGFGGSRLEKAAPSIVENGLRVLPGGIVLGPIAGGVLRAIDKGGHAVWAQDLRIPKHVLKCVHFVASHEVREKFPSDSVREDKVIPDNCVETFYPGMHSDVGGGYAHKDQEVRTNELSRVALTNMYINAYKAGVPLKPPDQVINAAGALFEISNDLEACWDIYFGAKGVVGVDAAPTTSNLETQIIWHMNRYYAWRASRRRRLDQGVLKPEGGVDKYMKITDQEWSADLKDVVDSKSGWIRSSVYKHEEAMYDAFYGAWIRSLGGEALQGFQRFFDHYVHDSIAGFKKQMSDASMGFAESSRWSVNRKIFMGKRGEKYLYWRYEGYHPKASGTSVAALEDPKSSTENQSALA
jgi:Uncharacterized alpha/beta hydrolase domain (DUF2235)